MSYSNLRLGSPQFLVSQHRSAALLRSVAICFLALLSGCGGGSGDGSSPALEVARASQVDARVCAVDHVWVTVARVEAATESGAPAGAIMLAPPRRIDLATTGGVLQELGTPALQPGVYGQLRLYLVANTASSPLANAVQAPGSAAMPLEVPSAVQSGIKVRLDFEVPQGQRSDLLLDFNACQAVVAQGNGGYVLKPVISARPLPVDVQLQSETRVNTVAGFNRSPSVTPLVGGGYLVAWVRGFSVSSLSADVVAQRFDGLGRPAGGEILVNTAPGSLQDAPDVSAMADGGFLIVWSSLDHSGIYAQRFDASGAPVGEQVRVDTVGRGPWQPRVAVLTGGGYVVVWSVYLDDGSEHDIHAQVFDARGARVGAEIAVNAARDWDQLFPSVAALPDGGFLVAWERLWWEPYVYRAEVHTQRYSSSGTPVGMETKINTDLITAGPTGAGFTAVVPLAAGGYVVAWTWSDQSEPDFTGRMYFRRFDASGTPIGEQQLVVVGPTSTGPVWLEAAPLSTGGFVLTWAMPPSAATYTYNIYAQRFDASGAPMGSRVLVNTTPTPEGTFQDTPDVAALPGGGYVVTWQSGLWGVSIDIYMQRFWPSGAL